jgi:hypothetical protein
MSKILLRHTLTKKFLTFLTSLSLYIFTKWKCIAYNESGRFGALKSDSTHHFFRNDCTKSGSLRFSQFSSCWLILSVYIIIKNSWHFWLLYLYTFSLNENASLIIFCAETEYISTRYWYRNINFLKEQCIFQVIFVFVCVLWCTTHIA